MWRLNNIGQLIEPLALRIHEFWNGFPRNKKLGLTSTKNFRKLLAGKNSVEKLLMS